MHPRLARRGLAKNTAAVIISGYLEWGLAEAVGAGEGTEMQPTSMKPSFLACSRMEDIHPSVQLVSHEMQVGVSEAHRFMHLLARNS